MFDKPYFFTNPKWYEIFLDDNDVPCVKLTALAPKKAIDSFNEYFNTKKHILEVNDNG